MANKTSQKGYYDSFEDFDAIELGVVDGRENEYRKRFISRRAEKMAKIAGLDAESTILEVGCGTGIYSTHWVKSSIKFYGLDIYRRKLMQVLKRFIARIFKEGGIPKPAKPHGNDFTHHDLTMEDFTQMFAEVGIHVEHKIFMGFVHHQIIPTGVARYFMFMEVLEKVLERIPWVRAWGGIVICGVKVER